MFAYIWPLALVVLSNVAYQICTKETPDALNPLASLTVTYLVGAVVAGVLYYATTKNADIIREYSHMNWSSAALGVSIVGLEVGFIYAYKAGWQISTLSIVQSAFLAILLIFVGFVLYKEALSPTKLIGIVICLVGLYFINK